MPSPFPGMDPYLEAPQLWPDLHQRLITYISDELQQQIRPNYHARIGERLYVVQTVRDIYPDVALVQRPRATPPPGEKDRLAVATMVADEPLTLTLSSDEYREPFIEITHLDDGQVVTIIEVLSPANKKPGQGHELYRQKQQEVLNSETHLVEIDLLSQGLLTIAMPEDRYRQLPPHRYRVSVSRGPGHIRRELYLTTLSQRLPRFRVPLKAPDPDVVVDLPAIFTRCYDNGGYADFIDYQQPPPAPLSAEEQAWVAENMKREV